MIKFARARAIPIKKGNVDRRVLFNLIVEGYSPIWYGTIVQA